MDEISDFESEDEEFSDDDEDDVDIDASQALQNVGTHSTATPMLSPSTDPTTSSSESATGSSAGADSLSSVETGQQASLLGRRLHSELY